MTDYNSSKLKKVSDGVYEYDGMNAYASKFKPHYFQDEACFKEGDTVTIKTLNTLPVGTPQPEDDRGEPMHAGIETTLERVFVLKPDGVTLTMRDR